MRKLVTIWHLIEMILKLPALFLIFCYFGVMIFFNDIRSIYFFTKFMNNQLDPIERRTFFDEMNTWATHISYILYLTILAYFILA